MSLVRTIKLIGTIDTDMLKYFIKCVEHLRNRKERRFRVIIHSGGGDALAGLAIAEYMRVMQTLGFEFTITAIGDCSSAATIILAQGDLRIITKNSWVMVHEDSGEVSGNVTDMETEIRQKRKLEDQWNRLFEGRTGTSKEVWDGMNKETTYLDANECQMLGLVDEVI